MDANNKQPDFKAVVGIIAIILVVGVIGFISWRHYYRTPNEGSYATIIHTNKPTIATTAAVVTSQGTYLDIKEIGIKVPLGSAITDAVYSLVPTTDGSTGIGLSAQSLLDKSSNCTTTHYSLGLIEASSTAPTDMNGKPLIPDDKSLFKFGSTYYWYRPPQVPCLTNQTDLTLLQSKINAFEQAYTTTQAGS